MKVFNGDCLKIMKDLSSNSIDCFICDLPYGCLTNDRKGKRVGKCPPDNPNGNIVIVNKPCDWDIPIDLEKFWIEVKRLAKDDHTPVLMFCTTKFGYELIKSNPSWFRYDLVWEKTNAVGFLCANKMPLRSHEMIYVFSKSGAYYDRIDISGNFPKSGSGSRKASYLGIKELPDKRNDNTGKRCAKSVIKYSNKKGKDNHPTQKPEDLYEFLISRYCPKGGTILDPTSGSFTSCKVAERIGRKAIGIEMNKEFFEKYSK